MSVKSEILSILEQNREEPISGEAIASRLNVSRAYVWKAINKLKQEGYHITATPNLGYILNHETDVLSKEGILPALNESLQGNEILVYKTIDSTNTEAKKLAVSGAAHGTVIISEEQTAGRGRRGRSFYSPKGLGIYMSFVLKPTIHVQDSVLITTAASVAVSRAIDKVTGIQTKIKWVNDLFYKDKKICGILTEAVTDCDTGCIDSLILGIGINFCMDPAFVPVELKEIVGGLFETKPADITRNLLCAQIINEVMELCDHLTEREFLHEYKEKSMVIGERILVIGQGEPTPAQALDIDSTGGLVVEFDSGEQQTLTSGEISIRKINS